MPSSCDPAMGSLVYAAPFRHRSAPCHFRVARISWFVGWMSISALPWGIHASTLGHDTVPMFPMSASTRLIEGVIPNTILSGNPPYDTSESSRPGRGPDYCTSAAYIQSMTLTFPPTRTDSSSLRSREEAGSVFSLCI